MLFRTSILHTPTGIGIMKLTDFKALSFDCYGTLIDWETGILNTLRPWVEANDIKASPDKILEVFGECESIEEVAMPSKPYPEILEGVQASLCQFFKVKSTKEDRKNLANSVGDWPLFPDSFEALKYLKQHFKLVILSNVDKASFNHSNKKLGIDFDAIYVAGEIYNYKPSKKNFFYMLEHGEADLSLIKGDFIHTAQSLFHDHKPAIEMGFTTCWIDRRGNKGGGITPKLESPIKPHFKFGSMAELVKAVKMELV